MKKVLLNALKLLFWVSPVIVALGIIATSHKISMSGEADLTRVTPDVRSDVQTLSYLPNVVGAGVVIADMKSNRREMLTYQVNDVRDMALFIEYMAIFGTSLTVFNQHGPNTIQMLDVLNGGSVCFPFSASVMAHQMPKLNTRVKTMCLFGLPFVEPRYRHYILILTNAHMSMTDFAQYEHLIGQTKQNLFLSWVQK